MSDVDAFRSRLEAMFGEDPVADSINVAKADPCQGFRRLERVGLRSPESSTPRHFDNSTDGTRLIEDSTLSVVNHHGYLLDRYESVRICR